MTNKIYTRVIEWAYENIFGEKISLKTLIFLKSLKYVIFGYGIAGFCVFVFEILCGRILGPNEYGKFVLVNSVGMFLYFFMTMGVTTAAVKYNAEKEEYNRQQKITSTSYWFILIISFTLVLLFFIFSPLFSKFFSIPLLISRLSIIFAFFYTLYLLVVDSLRGLHQFKKLAIFRATYGFLILIIFILFLLNNYLSFKTAVFAICLAYLIIFSMITVSIRSYLSFEIDKIWLKNLLEYGIYAAGGSFLFVFLPTLSKIMVNKYLTVADVGIYNAYYFSSLNITLFFYNVFITVFFPTASKYQQKAPILKKIKKLIPFMFLIGTPLLFVSQLIVLNFYGPKYPINYFLMFLFALSGILFLIYGFYSWLFFSKGIKEVRLIVILITIMFLINVFLSIYFIPRLSFSGAVLAILLTYLTGVICLFFSQKKLIE